MTARLRDFDLGAVRDWVQQTEGVLGPDAPRQLGAGFDTARAWWRDCHELLAIIDEQATALALAHLYALDGGYQPEDLDDVALIRKVVLARPPRPRPTDRGAGAATREGVGSGDPGTTNTCSSSTLVEAAS